MRLYPAQQGSDGPWRVNLEVDGKVEKYITLEDGALPAGSFTVWPTFTSKEDTEAFIAKLERGEMTESAC